jgi:hypothetical protein
VLLTPWGMPALVAFVWHAGLFGHIVVFFWHLIWLIFRSGMLQLCIMWVCMHAYMQVYTFACNHIHSILTYVWHASALTSAARGKCSHFKESSSGMPVWIGLVGHKLGLLNLYGQLSGGKACSGLVNFVLVQVEMSSFWTFPLANAISLTSFLSPVRITY